MVTGQVCDAEHILADTTAVDLWDCIWAACDVFLRNQVLTKDSVTVSVDAVVYYRVSNATVSVANVENAHHSTRLLAQTTLRNILGTKDLHEILGDRETISGSMQVCSPL